MRRPLWIVLLAAGSLLTASLEAQRLGRVNFPTSGKPAAQPAFIRGVLLLHSFEYGAAAKAFVEAQQIDPGFAMAYWGEAMTYTHPMWNEQNIEAGRAALGKLAPTTGARRAKAPTARERGFLRAVDALYGEGTKPKRDTLYELEMERLARENPADLEAQTFYALSLLGLSQSVRVVPTYERAGAIALEAFRRNPDHPGAAHYTIHAFDDPAHASRALPAARAYAQLAADAAHAQHMTTHIFLAKGMWDDVISQNFIASGHDHGTYAANHYTMWLLYGLQQAGRTAEAGDLLQTVHRNLTLESARAGAGAGIIAMRSIYVIGGERWTDMSLTWKDLFSPVPVMQAMDAFTAGFSALKRNDAAGADRSLSGLRMVMNAPSANGGGAVGIPGATMTVLELELRGAIAFAAGKRDEAIGLIEQAAKIEDGLPVEFGPPPIVKPSRELLGEMLIDAGRGVDAQREFTRVLTAAPNRAASLVGLIRAAASAKNDAAARRGCATLKEIWHRADKDRLAEIAGLCH